MFASKLFQIWLFISSHRLAQLMSIYTDPEFMKLILKISNEMQLDLTGCLAYAAKGKVHECIATIIFDQGCDFYLYQKCTKGMLAKRRCKKHPTMLQSSSNYKKLQFNRRKRLVVIVHGVCEKYTSLWLQTAKNHLLDNRDVNVVMMDWRSNVGYSMVAFQRSLVVLADVFGRRLAGVIENLVSTGVSCSNVHLVGVGMGAQIVAFAGKYLKAQNKTVGRITGLNPSGDIFDSQPSEFRLDKMDAAFVDCIFTSSPEIAMRDPVCGANFYPNCYGKKQPGEDSILSQDRATILFSESVIPDHKFHAKKCAKLPCHGTGPRKCKMNGTALMGYPASRKLKGIFYVKIGGHYPFSTAIKEPKLQNNFVSGWVKRQGKIKKRKRDSISSGDTLPDEVALLEELVAQGLEAGWSLTICTAKTLFGYTAAIECIISNFMVQDCDFYLYTKKNRGTPKMLHINELEIQAEKLNIDKHKKIVFLIHGVTVNYMNPWVQKSKDGVIPLTKTFAKEAAVFLTGMLRAAWEISNFHLVGHSLGGQIVGFVGKELKQTRKTLPRMTALDPSGFVFDYQSPKYRLDRNDAKFVDCVFTSSPFIGMRFPVCTANFYVNCYGKEQPGTESDEIGGSTQCISTYTDPKFMKLILKISNELQLDLTGCLADAAKGKVHECIATTIFDQVCDFYLYQKCTEGMLAKSKCKKQPTTLQSSSNYKKLQFNRNKKLVVIVHGVSEKYTSLWLQTAKNHLLDNHEVNVVMMDWRSNVGYSMVAFPRSLVVLADVFGRRLAGVLENLVSTGVSCSNLHLVGVGMGAQIVAFAGKYLKAQNKTIGRITGLNPSGDIFDSQPSQFRLDQMDAAFVDCIFTSSPEIAMRDPVCHANFYPNCYGKKQPGEDSIESQDRAAILFAESVIPDHTFHAKKCAKLPCHGTDPNNCKMNGTAVMGYPASQKLKGIFYVKTGGQYPFSTVIEKPKLRKRSVSSWIGRLTGEKTRGQIKRQRHLGSKLVDEVALLQKLVGFGVKEGWSLTICTAKNLIGYKAATECIISNFMVQDCDFYLYTKENRGTPKRLHINELKSQAEKLNVDKTKKIVFFIHGVTVNYTVPWIQQSKDDLLANYDVNVIAMDWRSKVDHILMASNAGLIPLAKSFGKKAAGFLTGLLRAGWEISNFHLVGHSLGGQIVGFVGEELKQTGKTLPRITALDPAGLLFDHQSTKYRLDKNDAEFVDCVFTTSPIIGMRHPECTANFYANCYGKDQPGTKTDRIGGSTTLSHLRAAWLFAESVVPSHEFHAKKCEKLPCHGTDPEHCVEMNGTALMGYPASSKKCQKPPTLLQTSSNHNKLQFNSRKKLVVIVHGISEKYTSLWLQTAKNHLLDNHDVNVVIMDWRSKVGYSMVAFQLSLVVLADVIGRRLADVLENLVSKGVSCSNVHLVGVGMGAQIVAFAGKYLKAQNKTIGRITGLNPSGDIFDSQPTQFRLDKMDAEFVDCIFTSSTEIAMRDPVCGANFYPNRYGEKQPGEGSFQSQDRATILFAESVIPDHTFHANKCAKLPCHGTDPSNSEMNGTALMGYPASQELNGIFYVKTGGRYPFSTAIEESEHQKDHLSAWFGKLTGQKRPARIKDPKRNGGLLADELALIEELIAYALEAGWTLTICAVKTLTGYKEAIECIISNFMVQNCDFYLYTKENRGTPNMLYINKLKRQAKKLNIDKNKKIVFLIHGVTVNYKMEWVQQSKDDLLANHDVNVIAMDWRSKVDPLLMASIVGLVPLAKTFGKKAAGFLTGMLRAGWKISKFHLVGHSLGGQIVSFMGKGVKKTKKTLRRITALDPAGVIFDHQSIEYRLDKSDAKFVDCIFTSSPVIGMRNPVCAANFYPNCYGKEQPGTESDRIGGSTGLSHIRAASLFAESVIPSHKFRLKKCKKLPCHGTDPEDCVKRKGLMGYPASFKLRGIFYIKTRSKYPFAMKIKKKSNKKRRRRRTQI